MNFMILSYLAPYHKVVSLLRRLSRTCFIMSFGSKQVLKFLQHKTITLPLVSTRSLVVQPQAEHASFELGFNVSFKQREDVTKSTALPPDCAYEATELSVSS